MNKKYVIILAVACALCLGAGIVIGMGISQNNLAATGANLIDEPETLPTAEDFAAMEPADLKIAFGYYSDRLFFMERIQELTKKTLAEVRESKSSRIDQYLRASLSIIEKALEEETFKHKSSWIFHLISLLPREFSLSGGEWRDFENELEEALVTFEETAASCKTAIADIRKALLDKGIKY